MKVLGIDHIGIAVKDLAAAEATYRDVLGLPISGRESLPERGLEVVIVKSGDGHLELLAETQPSSEIHRFLEQRGEGIHHICLRVHDLDASVAAMRERGARIAAEPKPGAHGRRVAFIHPKSSHGVLLELVEDQGTAP